MSAFLEGHRQFVEQHVLSLSTCSKFTEHELPILETMVSDNYMLMNHHSPENGRIWFDRYKQTSELLKAKAQRVNPKPMAGDVVTLQCVNGRVYENALIIDTKNTKGYVEFIIIREGSGLILDPEQSLNEPLKMVWNGGPAIGGLTVDDLQYQDISTHHFWIWANQPVAYGALWLMKQPVIRWKVTSFQPQFY